MIHQSAAIVTVIKSIPAGKVLTYGKVAELAGYPGGARQVARTLHTQSKAYRLPWHRVVGAGGKIATKGQAYEDQVRLLEAEGVMLEKTRIRLPIYEWQPDPRWFMTLEDQIQASNLL